MLPKAIRLDLRHRPNFFKTAHQLRSPHLTFIFQSIEDLQNLQAAVVVKKRAGRAVERGKIRRTLRSAITELWKEESSLFDTTYGVVVLPYGKRQTFEQYKNELREGFIQIASA